jgi:flagellar biosynthesis protein FliR
MSVADIGHWMSPWTTQLVASALVLLRVSGLLAVGPILGRAILPWQTRAALAVTMTLVLAPLSGSAAIDLKSALLETNAVLWVAIVFFPTALTEFGLGFLLGCAALGILWAVPLAGHLLDQQTGAVAEEAEPFPGESPQTRWLALWAATCFLLCSPVNGHVQLVTLLADSFHTWPLGGAHDLIAANAVAALLQNACRLSLLVLAPALATLLLMNLSLGLLASASSPGISLSIGNTVRPLVALVVVAASLSGVSQIIADVVPRGLAMLATEPLSLSDETNR